MPVMIIVAGPNGAGKTSFASRYLSGTQDIPERRTEQDITYVNADEIARGMPRRGRSENEVAIAAGRRMLNDIERLVGERANVMFETTLATRSYARAIPRWKLVGYTVVLIYLRLPSADLSIARVARRVASGGHDVPEDVIRRRFDRSLDLLERVYRPLVDACYIYRSDEAGFILEAP